MSKLKLQLFFLPKSTKILASYISDFLFLLFSLFVSYQGYNMANNILELHQTSPSMGIPMGYVYLALPIGYCLTSIRLIENIVYRTIDLLKGRKEVKI